MRLLTLLLALLLAVGCRPIGILGTGEPGSSAASAVTLTIVVPPEILPGYRTSTLPGGSATVAVTLSNAALLATPRTETVTLVGGQTQYTVEMKGLTPGNGYKLEAEAKNAGGTRLAYTNQLTPSAVDPVLGQPKTLDPYITPPQVFALVSGANALNAGLRILPVSGNAQGPTAGALTGSTGVVGGYKKALTLAASPSIPVGYVTTLTLSTSALVTAGKLRADMTDLRILYWNGERYLDLDRDIESPNSASTKVMFRAQKAIAEGSTDPNYWLVYGTSYAAPAPSDAAQVYDFFDGFQYPGSEILAKGWSSVAGTATMSTSGAQSRTGGTSLQLNTNTGDNSRVLFRPYAYPTDFVMTAWFYDDLDTSRNDYIGPLTPVPTAGVLGIYTVVNTTNYHHYANGGAWAASGIARTTGWHKLEFRRHKGTMRYLIDGTQVATALDPRTPTGILLLSGGNAGLASLVFWDDISVRAHVSPEPAATLGSEQAL